MSWDDLDGWDAVALERLPAEIAEKVAPQADGCWQWTGNDNGKGYGQARVAGRLIVSHRVVYELLVGPIPDGMVLDHLCRQRSCCNPGHLEVVTPRENVLRGVGPSAEAARATRCPQGHPYDEANTRVYRGRRYCRECNRNGGAGRRSVILAREAGA